MNCQLTWKIKRTEVLIYDRTGSEHLNEYIQDYSHQILDARKESLNVIALSIALFIKPFTKDRLSLIYINTYVWLCKPKVIITFIDNACIFYQINNQVPHSVKIAIQNGNRSQAQLLSIWKESKGQSSCDYILAHSHKSATLYKDCLGVTHGLCIGSLLNNKFWPREGSRRKDTVLFLSQYAPFESHILNEQFSMTSVSWHEFYLADYQVVNFLDEWCKLKNKKLLVLGRARDLKNIESESKYFGSILKHCDWEYCTNTGTEYSYSLVDSVEMVVGISSTLAYESLSRGNKTIFFSGRLSNLQTQPVEMKFGYPYTLPEDGPFWTNSLSQKRFKDLIEANSLLSYKEWLTLARKYKTALMNYDYNNTVLTQLLADQLS